MSEIKADEGGGPAFPSATEGVNSFGVAYPIHETGMSLRDYFAAQALAQIINSYNDEKITALYISVRAYEYADAMLEARKAKT